MSERRWGPSDTYDISASSNGVLLRRRKRDSLGAAWVASAVVLAAGTPLASLVVGRQCAWISIFGGMVLAMTGLLSTERRAMRPHVVTSPKELVLGSGPSTGYRAQAFTGSIVVDGAPLEGESPLGVAVMARTARGRNLHTVALVTSNRVVHVDTTMRPDVAHDLAANVREALGLRAVASSTLPEPSPRAAAIGRIALTLLVELTIMTAAPMLGILLASTDVTATEIALRAGAIGIVMVLLSLFAGVLARTPIRSFGETCLAQTTQLLEKQVPVEPEPLP